MLDIGDHLSGMIALWACTRLGVRLIRAAVEAALIHLPKPAPQARVLVFRR